MQHKTASFVIALVTVCVFCPLTTFAKKVPALLLASESSSGKARATRKVDSGAPAKGVHERAWVERQELHKQWFRL